MTPVLQGSIMGNLSMLVLVLRVVVVLVVLVQVLLTTFEWYMSSTCKADNNRERDIKGSLQCLISCNWKRAAYLVVARQPVDAGLNQNQAELAILVLAVALQVLAHGHGLLDEAVQVFGDLGGQARTLQDTQDLAAGDGSHLRDAVLITEQHADGGGGHTLPGQLADVLCNLREGQGVLNACASVQRRSMCRIRHVHTSVEVVLHQLGGVRL